MAARLNARFGLFVTLVVGTMWCAYLFTLLALVSLSAAINSHNKIIIVAWIAQTFLQLVLLPIIIVGQNVQATAADKRAEDTYKDAESLLHEAIEILESPRCQRRRHREADRAGRHMTERGRFLALRERAPWWAAGCQVVGYNPREPIGCKGRADVGPDTPLAAAPWGGSGSRRT